MIKRYVKKFVYSNKYTKMIYKGVNFALYSNLYPEKGNGKYYPEVLQMPITTKCNSKCIMCNIPNMNRDNEMTYEEFGKALSDPIFKNIKAIGINGGEPFLLNDLEKYVNEAIVHLPNLKYINIISNGFLTERILEKTQEIYSLCKKKNKSFDIMFSLDGYGEIHDRVRGIPGAFKMVSKTIGVISNNLTKYADRVELACTVVKANVNNLVELDTYCKLNNYNINYRLGIENKRIGNVNFLNDFSVLYDSNAKQTAKEFFYSKYMETKNYKYYSIFNFLAADTKRTMGCVWKERGITMDPKGNIYYCAVESKSLGNIRECTGDKIFFNKDNIKYRQEIICEKCNKCIHDYNGKPLFKDILNFYRQRYKDKIGMSIYKRGI